MKAIDLNCDLGELDDRSDLAIMPYISSCNIACGGHAGNPELMGEAVEMALAHQVTIGAHPGYPDKENFGRVSIKLSETEIVDLVISQIKQLQQISRSKGKEVSYVKLHGALYHDAANDLEVARSVVNGVKQISEQLSILGPADSILEQIATGSGVNYFHESFIDRSYQEDGQLVPRTDLNAILDSTDELQDQLTEIVLRNRVKSINGKFIPLKTDSICMHGDHFHSLETAKNVKSILINYEVEIKSFLVK